MDKFITTTWYLHVVPKLIVRMRNLRKCDINENGKRCTPYARYTVANVLAGNPCVRPEGKRKLLTIVRTGSGLTGVEVAGMLAGLRNYILAKDYQELERFIW